MDISYVFMYLIFRHFIFIDAIKTVTLFIIYTHVVIQNVRTLGGERSGPAKGLLARIRGGVLL